VSYESQSSIELASSIIDNKSQAAHLVALITLIQSVPRTAYAHAMPIVS
jgi:hypothetical protein